MPNRVATEVLMQNTTRSFTGTFGLGILFPGQEATRAIHETGRAYAPSAPIHPDHAFLALYIAVLANAPEAMVSRILADMGCVGDIGGHLLLQRIRRYGRRYLVWEVVHKGSPHDGLLEERHRIAMDLARFWNQGQDPPMQDVEAPFTEEEAWSAKDYGFQLVGRLFSPQFVIACDPDGIDPRIYGEHPTFLWIAGARLAFVRLDRWGAVVEEVLLTAPLVEA
jgi:hypothetical protein